MIVYDSQTGQEKADGTTRGDNGIGFNKFDAPILTTIAEKYASCGYVTREELSIVNRLIRKYHRQWDVLSPAWMAIIGICQYFTSYVLKNASQISFDNQFSAQHKHCTKVGMMIAL